MGEPAWNLGLGGATHLQPANADPGEDVCCGGATTV